MALKFRRGTTAQQSGSLAFGEPYVNTTLGTLLIGGPNGDIVLSAGGTGSTGNFGAISGSGLDITGNANIAGNLTLGGTITIGDNSSDNVVVNADLSSSIIPNNDNSFDLGSTSFRYRAVYGTNIYGAINATNGVVSGSSQVTLQSTTGFTDYDTALATITGSLISSASAAKTTNDSQGVSITNLNSATASLLIETANLESFTSSINTTIKSKLDADGVISGSSQILGGSGLVSGSSQITLSSTTGFSAYSTSVDSRITTEKGRVDAILLAADADKDSFAEIVTLINSVDTSNDSTFASFYTASVGRLNNLESTSASVNISVSNLNTYTGSNDTTNGTQNTRLTALEASASTALSTNTTQTSRLDQLSTASGSAITRLTALEVETANLESFSSSALTRLTNLEGTDITITLTGDVTGTGTITNLGNVSFATTVAANQVALGTDTTGDYVASLVAGTNITLSNNSGEGATPTIGLTNNAITIAGTSTSLGGTISAATIGNAIGAFSGSSQVSLGSASGNIALATQTTGDYVASLVAGTGVTLSNNSGENATPTIAIGQAVATSSNVRFGSIGVGMDASGTSGRIDAANDIVAFSSSDIRFKENITPIENALQKISKISGNTYDWKEENKAEHGYEGNDVGVIAQEIEAVLPQLVQTRENGYKAVKYDKLVALLIEGIKEQQTQIHSLTLEIEKLKESKGL